MKRTKLAAFGLGALLVAAAGIAIGQTISVPQVTSIGTADLIQVVPNGQPSAQSVYATAALLGNYSETLPGNNPENALIGGDATTNLFQRATTGSSVTTTFTYGGPDRWGYWSGTNTAMTVSRTTTAAELPAGVVAGFKMAKTAAQTGVVQVCMAQALESVNSYQFAGQTAELSFYAAAGSTFSAASSQMRAYIVYGTGADGAAAALAFGINAGGGGGAGWTGQANAASPLITISTTPNRYTVVGNIPTTAVQVGVALCFTPVGTAGANDYITLSGIQLTKNNALSALTNTALPANDTRTKALARRSQASESVLQYRYFYKVTETAAIFPFAPCSAVDTTHTNCFVAFPTVMRTAPTMTYAAGFASPTSTTQATLGACTALASATTVTSTVAATTGVLVNCTATTIPAAGVASFLYSNGGTGTISANAEL